MSKEDRPTLDTERVSALAAAASEGMLGPNPFVGLRVEDLVAAVRKLAHKLSQNPLLVLEQELALVPELASVLAGRSQLAPAAGDKRFQDEAWRTNPLYRRCAQSYLAWCNALEQVVDRAALEEKNRERARFAVSLWTQAMAPSNTFAGNPAALKRLIDTGGLSLVKGLRNLLGDMAHNHGMPRQVDTSAFELGRNV